MTNMTALWQQVEDTEAELADMSSEDPLFVGLNARLTSLLDRIEIAQAQRVTEPTRAGWVGRALSGSLPPLAHGAAAFRGSRS